MGDERAIEHLRDALESAKKACEAAEDDGKVESVSENTRVWAEESVRVAVHSVGDDDE